MTAPLPQIEANHTVLATLVATHDLSTVTLAALLESHPDAKVARVHHLARAWQAGQVTIDPQAGAALNIEDPGRPERPQLVAPHALAHRGLGSAQGRIALLHAVAHIEFNAINLALDAAYRFRGLPPSFYADWIGVADDEARHFEMLTGRLAELGANYGDLPAHNGLWEMAVRTASDPIARMALVPRVLEARGLDVTPGMIARLRAVGDTTSAAILGVILDEEVEHVAIGSRWFAWLCKRAGIDPEVTFARLLGEVSPAALRGPLNHVQRRAAGFSEAELRLLARLGPKTLA